MQSIIEKNKSISEWKVAVPTFLQHVEERYNFYCPPIRMMHFVSFTQVIVCLFNVVISLVKLPNDTLNMTFVGLYCAQIPLILLMLASFRACKTNSNKVTCLLIYILLTMIVCVTTACLAVSLENEEFYNNTSCTENCKAPSSYTLSSQLIIAFIVLELMSVHHPISITIDIWKKAAQPHNSLLSNNSSNNPAQGRSATNSQKVV